MSRVYSVPEDELARLRAENAQLKAERERMAADALRLEAQAAAYRAALEEAVRLADATGNQDLARRWREIVLEKGRER